MQQQSKHTFVKSKMNKDMDARLLEAGEYRDGVNISVSRAEGDDVGALENILGNEFLNNLKNTTTGSGSITDPYSGVSPVKVIGWQIQENTDSIYVFITNYQDNSSDGVSNTAGPGTVHKIIYFNTQSNTSQVIVEGEFLNFSINSPITHTNLIENLLFWTDNRNQPRKINVDTAKSNPTYYFNEDHISVAKYCPWSPIEVLDTHQGTGIIVNKNITADPVTYPFGYDAWRHFFIFRTDAGLPGLSAETCEFLKNNIGCKGYVINADGVRWEFTVAWANYDEPFFPVVPKPPGWIANPFCVFIERDPTDPDFKFWEGAGPITQEYNFVFKAATQVDVSSRWLEESKSKLTIESFGVPGTPEENRIYYGINPPTATEEQYCAPLYKYGTRSQYRGLAIPDQLALGTECPTFEILDGDNLQKPIIKHPNLADSPEILITSQASNPDPLSGTTSNWFQIEAETAAADLGLSVGDVVTVYWPNPNYNPKFFGDDAFLEDKFVRFSYRFEFDDGEYSIIAPFTQSMFIPKQKGFFEKRVGTIKAFPNDPNYFQSQEELAGQNTIVDFFVNEVTQINLKIPLECPVNLLKDQFKVKSIDILYKESNELALKVVDTIGIDDAIITGNSTTLLNFLYQSQKPIKVLNDQVISRVYDNVPIRAAAQESSGNRIIYGNFYDRHTSPLSLDYLVNASPKFTLTNEQTSDSNITYPNHTLKQRRTYQAGIILADRYGRSSDVILSSFIDESFEVSNIGSFGGSTIYHPYFTSVTEPQTDFGAFNVVGHVNAGIYTWPGDSLKVLWANTIPTTISTNPGYPGLYQERITILDVTGNGGAGSRTIYFNPTIGDPSIIHPGMEITWSDASGNKYVDVIESLSYDIPGLTGTIIVSNGSVLASAVSPENVLQVNKKNLLGWYSYKVVVKQQEQEYYNVYIASLLNGNPVVKPFTLELDGVNVGDSRITVDSSMADPRTFLLLEGMQFQYNPGTPGDQVYTITNILNTEQFEITPASVTNLVAGTPITFTTLSTKNAINVTTLLTDNANKVPPGLVETTPVQQQYSTSQTRLIPRVAVGPKVHNYLYPFNEAYENYVTIGPPPTSTFHGVNKQIFPGKESLKVNSLGNFEGLFVDGSYAGLWQADTDPPTAIIQNKFQLGIFAENVRVDGGTGATDQLQFSCYETTPVKSELEIFYESSTSGLVEELNNTIQDGLAIPVEIHAFEDIGVSSRSIGTVNWNEAKDIAVDAKIAEFIIVDANGDALIPYDAGLGIGSIESVLITNITYANGIYAGKESTNSSIPVTITQVPPYTQAISTDPVKAAAGVYDLDLNDLGFGLVGGGLYHQEDDVYNNVTIDLNITVRTFGPDSSFTQVYPFQIQTYVENSAPLDSASPYWSPPPPVGVLPIMYAFVDLVTSWPIVNNSGIAETQDPAGLYSLTKTYNGSWPLTQNKSSIPTWSGSNELVYTLYLETALGSGIYEDISTTLMTGLTLVSEVGSDGGDIYSLSVGDVKYDGSAATATYGYAIGATDKNGLGLTTYVSKFRMNITY